MKTHFSHRTNARVALRRIARSGLADITLLALFAACLVLALCVLG